MFDENRTLAYFPIVEGRVRNEGGLKYEYMIADNMGNVRISVEDVGGIATVKQENSYYPFGLTMPGNYVSTNPVNNKLYNGGSEWQNDFSGLPELYNTFYRNYDPAIGRFIAVDPKAEITDELSTYHYAGNNPILYNDPMGDRFEREKPIGRSLASRLQESNYTGGSIRLPFGPGTYISTGWAANGDFGNMYDANQAEIYRQSLENVSKSYADNYTKESLASIVKQVPGLTDGSHTAYGNGLIGRSLPQVEYASIKEGEIPSWWGNSQLFIDRKPVIGDVNHLGLRDGFSHADKSNFGSTSSFLGYAGISLTKTESLLKYTAKTATSWGDKATALRAAKGFVAAGKIVGVAGAALTLYEGLTDGNGLTIGDGLVSIQFLLQRVFIIWVRSIAT
ncbi:RHS repeat-associated core domain-containing protein [Solitalea lacus]|uniref:RHS repeat-associated core domain-containing protein n=1 Tax=Solitalea lacus TaxID=2911172 RepID=UPI001EDBF363|nr:RHS repeat-associated core domain-containing protein [Solitalea lacus]UKJ06180.1 RHS repeat-associated core domain-containing protein [Solitalea lacus]